MLCLVLTFCIIRHGEEGATSLHAGLEHLGKETVEPTGTLIPPPKFKKGFMRERETFITKLGEGRKR